ncbi:MAG: metallophosphoesterase [Fibrobacter sp.]|jgi:bis(5'-nucleosyl)-tetraphosphatase (symmetrical)|nr:metallophosphoesterase [Fibrobacter sp.]
MSRSLFIGDVHGCFDELSQMIEDFAFVEGKDSIYLTGDVINKGPMVLECIRLIDELKIQAVLGNHEARFLETLKVPKTKWTEKEYKRMKALGEVEWVQSVVSKWPLWLDTPHALLVHAGLEPAKDALESMDEAVLLSVRKWSGKPWFEQVSWPKTVVFGHWAQLGFVNIPGFIGLDSGCVYGKALSGWCPEENRFYQVLARKEYSPVNLSALPYKDT